MTRPSHTTLLWHTAEITRVASPRRSDFKWTRFNHFAKPPRTIAVLHKTHNSANSSCWLHTLAPVKSKTIKVENLLSMFCFLAFVTFEIRTSAYKVYRNLTKCLLLLCLRSNVLQKYNWPTWMVFKTEQTQSWILSNSFFLEKYQDYAVPAAFLFNYFEGQIKQRINQDKTFIINYSLITTELHLR